MKFFVFLLCCALVFAVMRAGQALWRMRTHVRQDKAATYTLNQSLPNAESRDTDWDYVDRKGWSDLASAQMWGLTAVMCALGLFVILFVAGI